MIRAALLLMLFYGVATLANRSTVIDPEMGLATDEETEPFDPLQWIDFGELDVNDLENPYVQAFLETIRVGEGTAGTMGYQTMFGGGIFTDFSDHSRQVICRTVNGGRLCSSESVLCGRPNSKLDMGVNYESHF